MGNTPTPAPASTLTAAQLAGAACVWCRTAVAPGAREHVGFVGHPVTRLYGCTYCVVTLGRRLPVWPELGSC